MTVRTAYLALFCAAALAAVCGPARADVADPRGDFLPSYLGAKTGDLDVLSASVSYDEKSDVFDFSATFDAPVGTTKSAFYVFGLDRGQGTEKFNIGANPIGAGVSFDSVVVFQLDGSAMVNRFSGAADTLQSAASFAGNTLSGTISGFLLPSTGFAKSDFTWNLWPRDAFVAGNASISDFAPDASNAVVAAVPEPQTYALLCAGLAFVYWTAKRRKPALSMDRA